MLDAALVAVADAAPGPVRVADIATRAGMSAGHVMYYFQDRDTIVAETLLHAEEQLAVVRDRRLARARDGRSAVEALVRLYLPAGRSDPRWKLWAQLLASPPGDTATRTALAQVIEGWSEAVADAIRRGCAEGSFDCPDAERSAYQVCRLMDGYALEILLGAPGRTRSWAVRDVRDYLLGSLTAVRDR